MSESSAPPERAGTAGGSDQDGRIDWRGPTLGTAAWVGGWAGTSGAVWLGLCAGAAGLVLGLFGLLRRRWLVAACGAVLLAAVGVSGARVWVAGLGPVPAWAREGAVVTIEARVAGGRVTDSGPGGPLWVADGRLQTVVGRSQAWDTGGTVRLSASGELTRAWADVPVGSMVRAVVRLSPAGADEPVSAWARARSAPEVVAPPSPVEAAVTTVRAGLRQAVSGLPPDPRALVPALVVGDTDAMTAELQEKFRSTGLTHLTAVSGENLTLMLAAMLWFAARAGLVGWWRRGLVMLGVVAFVLLCRAEPSVLRAAAMGLISLAALGWGGTRQGLRYLSWAVVLLVLTDPWLSRSTGFALSVCASAGIIVWAGAWSRSLGRWLPRWLAEAVAVPIAAQLATQPIVTAISGQISLAGVAANLLAAPLVGPGTVLGFLAAGLSVVMPPLAALAGWLAGGFAQGLCWVAEAGSSLPGAVVAWPDGPLPFAVLTVACVVALVGLPFLWRRPWLAVLVGLAMVAVMIRPVSVPGWPPPEWQFVSCDIGQGDASVISAGKGRAIVVDTGPEPRPVDRCLDQLGVTDVAWLVITHLHADHVGGVAGVASGRTVERVLFSGVTEPAGGWHLLESTLPHVPRTVARPGMVVAAGAVQLAVLSVKPYTSGGETGEDSAGQNDSSVVMRVTSGALTVLLGGDVEEAGQANALSTAGDLSAQVLLVPHHGSAHQSPEFLGAVGERVALVSVGKDNDYGHPAARTIAAVAGGGAQIYRTDQNGSVAVSREGDTLQVTTSRSG